MLSLFLPTPNVHVDRCMPRSKNLRPAEVLGHVHEAVLIHEPGVQEIHPYPPAEASDSDMSSFKMSATKTSPTKLIRAHPAFRVWV